MIIITNIYIYIYIHTEFGKTLGVKAQKEICTDQLVVRDRDLLLIHYCYLPFMPWSKHLFGKALGVKKKEKILMNENANNDNNNTKKKEIKNTRK